MEVEIDGTVNDQMGSTLPGVTVTVSSPALQVAQLTMVSDDNGRYRFIDLPRGTYQLKFELHGFKTLTRSDLALTAEVDMKTFGNGAVVKEIGVAMNMVLKSGGNEFHGSFSGSDSRQGRQEVQAGQKHCGGESRCAQRRELERHSSRDLHLRTDVRNRHRHLAAAPAPHGRAVRFLGRFQQEVGDEATRHVQDVGRWGRRRSGGRGGS
jgi:hypothetical protein